MNKLRSAGYKTKTVQIARALVDIRPILHNITKLVRVKVFIVSVECILKDKRGRVVVLESEDHLAGARGPLMK